VHILKAAPERDLYVVSSTSTSELIPTWWGTRSELSDYLFSKKSKQVQQHPQASLSAKAVIADLIDRIDEAGSSSATGTWDETSLVLPVNYFSSCRHWHRLHRSNLAAFYDLRTGGRRSEAHALVCERNTALPD